MRIICYIGVDVDNSNRLALGFAHTLKVLELFKMNSRPWKSLKISVGAGKSLNYNANFVV